MTQEEDIDLANSEVEEEERSIPRDWAEQVDKESKEKKEDSVEKEEESRPTAAVPGTWWCLRTCKAYVRPSGQKFLIWKGDIITKANRSPTEPDWLIGIFDGRGVCVHMADVEPLPPKESH